MHSLSAMDEFRASTPLSVSSTLPSSRGTPRPAESSASSATTASNTPFEGLPPSRGCDIAVVGLGCRVAGGNNSPSKLWDFLLNKGDANGEIPSKRWEPYFKIARNANILSKTTSRGYFLDNLEDFDASFFGISPREAEQIDPQQRIALEVAWEALEDAGIPPQSLAGSDTAVYMGVDTEDYSRMLLDDLPNIEAWMGVGTALCGIPNRISYLLDLHGPSAAADAACASSIVAIHHARLALQSEEASLAIAGGVKALAGPCHTRVLDEAGAVSPDGRCRSFDDTASGYGRGEGCGIVILKRMDDALRDGDRIYATLKGSALGSDGRTKGIMAPNPLAQEMVARKALKTARVAPSSVAYVEAHATSTPLGDPTECSALANVYGSGAHRPGNQRCLIGSLKPNIGHLESGAGVMGFIKAVMAIHTGVIPPQANLKTLNKKLDWEASGLQVVTEPTKWPAHDGPRRAGVASYGYGGTVSHAIVEAAPVPASLARLTMQPDESPNPTLLLLSVPQAPRMAATAKNLAEWLDSAGRQSPLSSVATTLATKRGHHPYRAAIVAEDHTEAVTMLKALSERSENAWIFSSRALSKDTSPGAVWVFSGHGAQWKGMGRALLESEPRFMDVLGELEQLIQEEMGFSVIDALQNEDFDSTDKVQTLTYVMHVGIATVLRSKGVEPHAIIGHSVGEIAAAVTAGALTVREGALITCKRARLYRTILGEGAMIFVGIPFSDAAKEIGERNDIAAAVDSSPTSCVVSGKKEVVAEFAAAWKAKGIQVRTVKSDVAFHSPVLNQFAAPLQKELEGLLVPGQPSVPLYSTSLPSDPRGTNARNVKYWVDNMLNPVLLTSAVTAAAADGYRVFLEVSSHPIVTHSIKETLMEANVADDVVIPTMQRDKPVAKTLLLALGKLHCAGATVDFKKLLPGQFIPEVPGTVWDHQPYWRNVNIGSSEGKVSHDVRSHTLLGKRTEVFGTDNVFWQTHLDDTVKPFPRSHFVHDSEIIPAATSLNTFHHATGARCLEDIKLRTPLVIMPAQEVQVLLQNNQISISSRLAKSGESGQSGGAWLTNTTARVSQTENSFTAADVSIPELKARLETRLSPSFTIDYLATLGVKDMAFPWKVLEHIENESEMLATVDAAPEAGPVLPWDEDSWAPILDAATSIGSTILHREPKPRMVAHIDRVTIRPDTTMPRIGYIYVRRSKTASAGDVTICKEDGTAVAELQGMRFAEIEAANNVSSSIDTLVHKLAWPPAQLSENPTSFSHVVFLGKEGQLVQGYRNQLHAKGIKTSIVSSLDNTELSAQETIVIYVPDEAESLNDVFQLSSDSCNTLLDAVKVLLALPSAPKIYCITQGVAQAQTITALGQAPLHGLARIIQGEQGEVWGGLIDVEDTAFPLQAVKYVQGADVIRVQDTVARISRLRPFPREQLQGSKRTNNLQPRPQGTYLITGGLGALGLEVATWMVEKGARRIVLISRRGLPPRSQWHAHMDNEVIQKILRLESTGVTIYAVAADMTAPGAAAQLRNALDQLCLPPVLGVVHAAGVLEDQLVTQTTHDAFNRVISPKIAGALALNELFPPKTLDFFVFFSSVGQLVAFPGSSSYASGNAFLDAMAARRRKLGDNSVSMMYTCWRNLGMAAGGADFLNAEMDLRKITDVTRDEAFQAWEHIAKYDTDHAVIVRALPHDEDEPVSLPILTDIIVRRQREAAAPTNDTPKEDGSIPQSGPELKAYLAKQIATCVSQTLSVPAESVDLHMALPEMGVDSIMAVQLRKKLQQALKVKITPTLIWSQPTAHHLVNYFAEKLGKA